MGDWGNLTGPCRGCQGTGFIGAESNPGMSYCGCQVGRDRVWEERDSKKEKEREYFAAMRHAAHEAHVAIVSNALRDAGQFGRSTSVERLAEIAIKALEDDGVVFARMGSCDDDRIPHWQTIEDDPEAMAALREVGLAHDPEADL